MHPSSWSRRSLCIETKLAKVGAETQPQPQPLPPSLSHPYTHGCESQDLTLAHTHTPINLSLSLSLSLSLFLYIVFFANTFALTVSLSLPTHINKDSCTQMLFSSISR